MQAYFMYAEGGRKSSNAVDGAIFTEMRLDLYLNPDFDNLVRRDFEERRRSLRIL